MGKRIIPNKWNNYIPMSKRINGTRFVAFKVPIKENLCRHLPSTQRFFPTTVLDRKPKIALVINLTNTNKYYDKLEFLSRGVDYAQVACPAKLIPPEDVVQTFFDVVDTFFSLRKSEYTLIGVHCAHGLNRTGFMICKYMIIKMGMEPKKAIENFKQARGHAIERGHYIEELLQTQPSKIDMFSSLRFSLETIYEHGKKICEAENCGIKNKRSVTKTKSRIK